MNKYYFYGLGAIILWSTFATISVPLIHVPPFLLIGLALGVGSLCSFTQIKKWRVPFKTILIGSLGLFGYHLFLFLGFRFAPVVEVNLLNYLWPLFLVLFSPLILGISLNRFHIIGGLLGFIGAMVIVKGNSSLTFNLELKGHLMGILAAVFWALYSLLLKRQPNFSSAAIGLFCLLSSIMSFIIHTFLEPSYYPTQNELIMIVLMGLGPLGVAFFLWDASLKGADPRILGTLSYLTPVLSTLVLVLAGHAHFEWTTLLSLGLILSGAFLSRIKLET